MTLRGLLQRRGHVEHRCGVLGVEAEHLTVLGEELDRARIAGDQLPVVAPAGGDIDDQGRAARGSAVLGHRVHERRRLARGDAVTVDLQLGTRLGAHGQDVARGPHRAGGALDDAVEDRVEILGGHEV